MGSRGALEVPSPQVLADRKGQPYKGWDGVNVFGGGSGGMNEQHVKWVGKAVVFV